MKRITPKVSPIGNMGTEALVLPNHSGDNIKGFVSKTPVNDVDFANKKYVDDNAGVTTHDGLTGVTTDQHHAEAHTVVSHSDTTATGAELDTLTDNSIADTLHRHSELVASDGAPDPAVSVDATGNTEIVKQLEITGASRIRVRRLTAQTIPNLTLTKIQFDSVDYDNLGEYDNVTNYRFTATEAGYYMISASIMSTNVAWIEGKYWLIYLYKNGALLTITGRTEFSDTVTTPTQTQINDIISLAANDYLEIYIYHNQGGDVGIFNSPLYNWFAIHRLS